MARSGKARTFLTVIAVAVVLAVAALANRDKVYLVVRGQIHSAQEAFRAVVEDEADARPEGAYAVSIYYYPDRERDARAAAELLTQRGYWVDKVEAAGLEDDRAAHMSYIYFRQDDMEELGRLQSALTALLKEEFTIHLAGAGRPVGVFRVVLVN